jgi:hypothetical protein
MRRLSTLPPRASREEVRRIEANATPREAATNRLWACIIDVVAFAPAVRLLHGVAQRGQPELDVVSERVRNDGFTSVPSAVSGQGGPGNPGCSPPGEP